jgi:hypothetical protein
LLVGHLAFFDRGNHTQLKSQGVVALGSLSVNRHLALLEKGKVRQPISGRDTENKKALEDRGLLYSGGERGSLIVNPNT